VIPPEVIAEALKDVSPHGRNVVSTCRWLASLNVPKIKRRREKTRRFWLWIGTSSDRDKILEWEDATRVGW